MVTFSFSSSSSSARIPSVRCRREERGIALIWSMTGILIIAGIIASGSGQMRAIDGISSAEFGRNAQASSISEAGLADAFAWLRRQTSQPVTTFAPKLDLAANPPVNETDDPSVGLLRTFEISPGHWAQYEVRKGAPPEPFVDDNANGFFDAGESYTDVDGNGKRSAGYGTRDVTAERGLQGAGTVWLIESRARVFRRLDASLPLGQGQNIQIASHTLEVEARRLSIVPPAAAALCSERGDDVVVGTRGRIRAGSTAIAYPESTGSPNTSGAEVLALKTATPDYAGSIEDVFGVDWTELRSMADVSTTDPVNGFQSPLPNYQLTVVTGDVAFDLDRPLRGLGVFIVKGNVTIEAGSNSFFNGVLYVDGNLTARAPAAIRGTVIVTGDTDVRGTGGDYCEIEHDPELITHLQTRLGQYRFTKSRYKPAARLEDGRPDELFGMTNPDTTVLPPPAQAGSGSSNAGNFQTDDMIDAIMIYLATNPAGSETDDMVSAMNKFESARNWLALDPPVIDEALRKIKQGLNKLKFAAENGGNIGSLQIPIEGDGGATQGLIPGMRDYVDNAIGTSSESASVINQARTQYDAAVADMATAQGMMTSDPVGAMTDYRRATQKLRDALDTLGGN